MKAVIVIDSFKGCLTSKEAGEAAKEAFPAGDAEVFLVSDGGEGFSTIVTESLGGEFRTVSCNDPLGRRITARYGLVNDGKTAVIETAAASGIGLLRKDELNPAEASSFGTGEMIADALSQGVTEIWLGLGGSATCDGGTGMLRALGYRFMSNGAEITDANAILSAITEIDTSNRNRLLDSCRITGFYDVSVPFCGNGGAARMFAPQKGASAQLVEKLDDGLSRFAGVMGNGITDCPGAGAAGGIGGALHCVLGAEMKCGIAAVLNILGLDTKLKDCDLVITGEGRADEQTLQGKVSSGVLEYVRHHSRRPIRVLLVAGRICDREELLAAGFADVLQVTPEEMSLKDALKPSVAKANITHAVSDYLASKSKKTVIVRNL